MPKALPVIDASSAVCCSPIAAAALSEQCALEVAVRLKALADPTRLRLMSILFGSEGVCTRDLAPAVGLTEATISHHLGQLRKAGLVVGERRGMNVYYRVQRESLDALIAVFNCC